MTTTRKRRGRGEGAIFQRQDGLWVTSISLGYNDKGKRRRRTIYGKSKVEVQGKLRHLQGSVGAEAYDTNRLTVGRYLEQWLAVVKPSVEPNTYRPYEGHCKRHITPYLGNIKLARLNAFHVEGLFASLDQADVSPALQRKVGTTLTVALNRAVRSKLLPFNPATGVQKPKAPKHNVQVLDPDQVKRFLDAAKTDRLYALFVAALDTGMRPGELFALSWGDIDLDQRYIVVQRSLEEIEGRHRIKDVKTKKGRRRIDISAFTVAVLHHHRKEMLAAGFINGPVFCNSEGGYLRLGDVRLNSFKPILQRAKLPDIRLYDLRHTCATLLLLANESPKVVAERLGHATIQLTLDTYTHVLPTMQQRAAEKLSLILGQVNHAKEA